MQHTSSGRVQRGENGYNLAPDEVAALNEFTPEQQQKIIERAKILGVFANVVSKVSSMRVRIGRVKNYIFIKSCTNFC